MPPNLAAPSKPLPLINRERATWVMRQAGLDGLLVMAPLNVYYATNKTLVTERFSGLPTSAAVIPADPMRPIAILSHGFDFYYSGFDAELPDGVVPYLIGGLPPAAIADPAAPPVFPIVDGMPLSPREQRLRQQTTAAAPFYPGLAAALQRALNDLVLTKSALGVDGLYAQQLAAEAGHTSTRMAADLLPHIRAIKTPAEMMLMRAASEATVTAITAASSDFRRCDTLRHMRQRIFAAMAEQGLMPIFGAIAGVADEVYDEELREGQSLMIDFVGHLGFYQGDYGRTVFIGEPPAPAQRAAKAIASVWEAIREKLRPGLRFSEIHALGADLLKRHDPRLHAAFNPHLVGLQHWDQPRTALDGGPLDLALAEGMVLSVDCPLLVEGLGGSLHLEDLCLITADGPELLHPLGPNVIAV